MWHVKTRPDGCSPPRFPQWRTRGNDEFLSRCDEQKCECERERVRERECECERERVSVSVCV